MLNNILFVIEEGQFNQGDFDKAILMIELANMVGADAIEFQLARADEFYIESHPMYDLYKSREFSDEQINKLVIACHQHKLKFVATCLGKSLISKLAVFGADYYNINASDINNPEIIEEVVKTKKPFFVSIPLASIEEVEWVYDYIISLNPEAEFSFLHGQHPMASGSHSVDPVDTSLGFIRTLKNKYKREVGFIDHSNTNWLPSVAVAAGATIITKHLSPSELYQGPDFEICLNPYQMKVTIEYARKIAYSIGEKNKVLAKGEDLDKTVMRRSIVAACDIKAGTEINKTHLTFKRPGIGIEPNRYSNFIGVKAIEDISKDTILTSNLFRK
jgi:sialic acid synthase SpsE